MACFDKAMTKREEQITAPLFYIAIHECLLMYNMNIP